ncbi:MAG: gamma-glutamyltransferase family protein, partial [Novosphingobium sp.]|nr:gamma-glutamyltransferase family protein [Novosphingobium sp.]
MLRQGGSAMDAALATLLALNVVEPQSSGIGGGGFLVFDDGKGKVTSFDGRETAPMAADPDWFNMNGQYLSHRQAVPGGLSVGVPGNVAMMALAHGKYGKLPWSALFQPAIRLAQEGFEVTPRLHDYLERYRIDDSLPQETRELQYISKGGPVLSPQSRALYYEPGGEPAHVGATIRNPALASFLESLASEGTQAFYGGANAEAIASTVSGAPSNPAPMAEADLAAYRAKERAPVCSSYRVYRICGMGPPSSGATTVIGILGLLGRFDLHALGKDDPVSWHLIAEAERLTYADRARYLADADYVDVPVAGLIAPDYLAARSQLIARDKSVADAEPGMPAGALVAQADTVTPDIPSTSHFVAVDRHGAVVTLTSTIEGPFGSGLMVNGYFLNNELTDFSLMPEEDGKPVANRVEAGKRPLSSMSPTLVYGPDGRLRLAIGAAGGKTIPSQVAKAIIGVLDWGLTAQDAIALPLIYAPGGDTVIVEKGSRLETMIPALQALGHAKVIAYQLPLKANAIEVVDRVLVGAADPRSEGQAVSE